MWVMWDWHIKRGSRVFFALGGSWCSGKGSGALGHCSSMPGARFPLASRTFNVWSSHDELSLCQASPVSIVSESLAAQCPATDQSVTGFNGRLLGALCFCPEEHPYI